MAGYFEYLNDGERGVLGPERAARMKRTLRLTALAGATLFGVISVLNVATLVYVYIETYRLPPPPFPVPSYHQFPIYRLNRDLRDLAPFFFAFICCLILYIRSAKPENSK
jgi:hypothetical protein